MFTTKYAKKSSGRSSKKGATKLTQQFNTGGSVGLPQTPAINTPTAPRKQITMPSPFMERYRARRAAMGGSGGGAGPDGIPGASSLPNAPTLQQAAPKRTPRWQKYGMPDPSTLETNNRGFDITGMTPRAKRYALEQYGQDDKAYGPDNSKGLVNWDWNSPDWRGGR